MSIVPFPTRLFAGCLGLALMPVLLSAARPDAAKTKPVASAAEKVRKDLDQTITIPGQPNTLKDYFDVLQAQTKLNFIVDDKAFASLGAVNVLATDFSKSPLPAKKEYRAKDLLRTVLKQIVVSPVAATYVVVGDTVVITTEASAPYRLMEQRINVECEKEELATVLKRVGRESGTNLVLDTRAVKDGQTTVTFDLQDVTMETAVVVIAESVGLKPVRIGNVVFLTTKDKALEMLAEQAVGPIPLPPEFGAIAGPLP